MAALVAAIHFPETDQKYRRLWKMDGPDEPGHDEVYFEKVQNLTGWPAFAGHDTCGGNEMG
jgi:hypothetical protein